MTLKLASTAISLALALSTIAAFPQPAKPPSGTTPPNRWEKMGVVPIDQAPDVKGAVPAERSADETRRAAKAHAVATVLKENLNDPSSFELVRARVTDKGGVCLRFRGRNAFNAVMTEEIAIDAAGKQKSTAIVCSATSGAVDVTYIKYLL